MTERAETHGGNVHAAARSYAGPLVDFSASINPLGPSPKVVQAIHQALPQLVHYPDPACVTLRDALARHHGLPSECFTIGNGSVELIHLLPAALRLKGALILGPTFTEYAHAVRLAGGHVTFLMADRRRAYRPPVGRSQLSKACHGLARQSPDSMVILCNPNSPTGQVVPASEVRQLIDAAAEHQLWVLIDESFIDYCESNSVLGEVAKLPRLMVLRSFTKFHALPGLRVGYLVAAPDVARQVRARQPPWSVNTLAQAAAGAALADGAHAGRSRQYMRRERARFLRRLRAIPRLTVFASAANFLLLEVARPWTATTVADILRQVGLLVRDCSTLPGLNDRTLRIAVRSRWENDRLTDRLRAVLDARGGPACDCRLTTGSTSRP